MNTLLLESFPYKIIRSSMLMGKILIFVEEKDR